MWGGAGRSVPRGDRVVTLLLPLLAAAVAAGCLGDDDEADPGALPLALLVSYTGTFAANSINSERAVMLALEEVNRAGGIAGRRVRLSAHDIRGDGGRTAQILNQLEAEQVAAVIGPDSPNVINNLISSHRDRTLFLPGVAMPARDYIFDAEQWFTFAPSTWTLACAFKRQLTIDGRSSPLILYNPDAFHTELGVALKMVLGISTGAIAIPSRATLTTAAVETVLRDRADAILLMAFPESASSLVSELSFRTSSLEGTKWYLSPTLHTARFFENVPPGPLGGAQGLKPARAAGGDRFDDRFRARWQDQPLVESYAFYDAAALAALAMQAAFAAGQVPSLLNLGTYVRQVAGPGGTPVPWDQLAMGLDLVRAGQKIDYQGVSGGLNFDPLGDPDSTAVQWWQVDGGHPVDHGPPLDLRVTIGSPCPATN
jgi:ABC-type branched-subunit amino acid transport system substrate-binding protein